MSKRLFKTRVNSEKDLGVINMWVVAKATGILKLPKEAEQTKSTSPRMQAQGTGMLTAGRVGPRKKRKEKSRKNAKEPKGESFK